MKNSTARHNLHLSSVENSMLADLSGCMGMNRMELLRHLIWVEHARMKTYLAEHDLPPGTVLRLDTSGAHHHHEPLYYERKRVVRNIEGALVVDDWTWRTLRIMANRAKLPPERLVSDLVDLAVKDTELEFRPAETTM